MKVTNRSLKEKKLMKKAKGIVKRKKNTVLTRGRMESIEASKFRLVDRWRINLETKTRLPTFLCSHGLFRRKMD